MFCNGCGNTIEAGRRFCSYCGKEFLGPSEMLQASCGRVYAHVRLLSIFWLAYSALNVLAAFGMFIVANTIFLHAPASGPSWTPGFMHAILGILSVFILVKAALGFAVGWGLMNHAPWARILALILAFVSLFNIPLGTALGIYTLWVLLPADSERQYVETSAPRSRLKEPALHS